MSLASSQAQTFLRLVEHLRGRWRTDPALPRQIQALVTSQRAFGSRDRRLYRELIYTTLRYLPWVEPLLETDAEAAVRLVATLAADTPATQAFRAEYAAEAPPPGDKADLLPAWFREHCPEIFAGDELETQLRRAPLWLRLQTDLGGRAAVLAEFETRGWRWQASEVLPEAIQMMDEVDVTQTDAWRSGRIEVQDLGSQLVLETVGIHRGERWLDACAGAGGKSLQLARLLGPEGLVDAYDIRAAALEELALRARRADIRTIRIAQEPPSGAYAGVLVDAPCSGSGTWRRSPHLKWTTTPALVESRAALQLRLLTQFSGCVKPGGNLVYATCSLSHRENEDVVTAFQQQHPEFEPAAFARTFGLPQRGAGLLILPSHYNTDGFFVASLRRVV
jgi:16S rRNA (cytosine967-C5)-methyltransferase